MLELKKESGGYDKGHIPAEHAHAELLNLQNIGSPEKRLEQFFSMQDDEYPSGYAFEYMQLLSQYRDWQLIFIPGTVRR